MVRKLLNVGLLLATLAGCASPGGRACTADTDCGESGLCDVSVGLCYQAGTEPETDTCTPACAAYEACTTAGCRARFMELKILSPATTAVLSGETVQVSAQLVVNPTYAQTTTLPDTLIFSAARTGGGEAGTFGPVTRDGDKYTTTWTLPAAQGQITLTASHPTPEAVQSGAMSVQVDRVPPDFNVTFSSPPTRFPGNATQANQQEPTPGYETAFRRDESVTVTIEANEPVSNVTLTVVGIGPGGTAGQAQPPVTVLSGGACASNPPFCGTVAVDLSVPEMRDVRGSMEFRVEGQDAAGNRSSKIAQLKVTRWKWVFDTAGNILGTPAIGNTGTVYVGTSALGNGKTFAIGPEGDRKWEFATGDVSGSPAVGTLASDVEYIYVGAKGSAGTFLYALKNDGSKVVECSVASATENQSAIAVGSTETVPLVFRETGVAIFNGTQVRLVGVRPDAAATSQCLEITGTGANALPASIPGGSLVMKDQNVFYGASQSRVTSYDLATGSNSPRSGWPQNTNSFVRGLALVGDQLYGAAANSDDSAQGSVFTVPTTGGAISLVYPQTNTSRVFNLAIGSGNTAYFGAETATSNELLSLALGTAGATPAKAADVGVLRGGPAVGRNDRLYTFNTQGRVTAWTASSLTPLWNADLPLSERDISLTLDCRRDTSGNAVAGSTMGTLYAAVETKVYALIVDSPGLDPNAPWPKYQHDARNTGNPATPITNCP